ncbi:MAG: ATPase domain-containing protein [Nanoarchaeota archaeon]
MRIGFRRLKVLKRAKKAEKEAKRRDKRKILRIPSGVPGFDKLAEGGLLSESVNLVVGGAGSGKTIFAFQFLIQGAKRGEPGIYVTFEEKKDRIYHDLGELGWDLEELEKKKKIAIIEYTPEQVKKMLEEGGGEIEALIERMKAKRIVIDSITSFALLFESELERREASLALFELLRGWNTTAILTLEQEMTEERAAEHIASALEFEADSIILLYFFRPDGSRIRAVEILKMRGTNHSRAMNRFEISKGGIKIKGITHLGPRRR